MKLSINSAFFNKPKNINFTEINSTFENLEVTREELVRLINYGCAFAPQLKKNWRSSSNFICSDYLAVDIDKGVRLVDMIEDEYIKAFASFIYTTASHTEEDNRFRVIFELGETIVDANTMKYATSGISKKLGGDPSCTDASRMYYGSKGCEIHRFDNTLPASEVDKLILHGKESYKSSLNQDTKGSKFKSTIISRSVIDPDTTVYVRDGTAFRLRDLEVGTSIKCPFHSPDNNPSAFILKSQKNVIGVHCVVCKTTRFTSRGVPEYDFNYDLNNLKTLEEYSTDSEGNNVKSNHQNIIRLDEKYLTNYDISSDFIFVKSPKGSGKTVWLEDVVEKCKDEKNNKEEAQPEGAKRIAHDRWKGVLLIGHRRSLIASLAKRLHLQPYLEHAYKHKSGKYIVKQVFNVPQPYYAICADSLSTLIDTEYHKWPIVIIDEVEQVLTHLTSDTLKYRRNNTYQVFKHLINASERVYLMDSDLNRLTVESMYQLTEDKSKSTSIVINHHKVKDKVLDLYDSEKHLKSELITAITNNQKCYVCSNSKSKIIKLTALLEEVFGSGKKILSITSKNSQEQDIQFFIRNIADEILNYDVVLSSPTLGTGIDISFDGDEQKIDCVFGFFEQRVNTHFDIDQQLSRVRNPKQIKVWVSPQKLRFETDPIVIRREMKVSHDKFRQIVKIDSNGVKEYNDDEYLKLYSNVKSLQLASKNHLITHFVKLRQYNGWTINEVEVDEDDADEIRALEEHVEKALENTRIGRIMISKIITSNEYTVMCMVSDSLSLNENQNFAMRRYEIESFYLQHIDEDLIEQDADGKLRMRIREFQLLMADKDDILIKDISDEENPITYPDRKSRLHKKELYRDILIKSKLMNSNYEFNTIDPIKSSDLKAFVKFIKAKKQSIERLFEIDIRGDVDKKPMLQLKKYLDRLGILMDEAVPKKRPDGGKDYLYTLNQERILYLNDINTKRSDETISIGWHRDRNAETKNRLFTECEFEDFKEGYHYIRNQITDQIIDEEADDFQ